MDNQMTVMACKYVFIKSLMSDKFGKKVVPTTYNICVTFGESQIGHWHQ